MAPKCDFERLDCLLRAAPAVEEDAVVDRGVFIGMRAVLQAYRTLEDALRFFVASQTFHAQSRDAANLRIALVAAHRGAQHVQRSGKLVLKIEHVAVEQA